jgi:hypothetical protein
MKNWTILLMILVATASRLIPHVPNVTPVIAIALLGGAYFSNRGLAVLIPVLALWLSDLVLGFHSTMLFVYAAVAVIGIFASLRLGPHWTKMQLAMTSIGGSLFFFAVTNFGVWMMDSLYPKTAAGLFQCYVMAVPFLGAQVLGDLFFTAVLFGVVQAVKTWKPALITS